MRWNSTADHILLVKILETGGFNVDTVKVAEAWPESTDGEQPPTPRAIKERISKIRDLLKQGGVEVSGSSASTKRGGRVKKAGGSKVIPRSKATSSGPKNKRQTAAPDTKDPAEDNAEEPAEFEDQPEHPHEDKDEDSNGHDDEDDDEI